MNHYRLPLYLLIVGPCLDPLIPLIQPEGISLQSSTQTVGFLVMNVKWQILPLHVFILPLLHGPDSVTPNRALWRAPSGWVLVHHPTTPIHHLITPFQYKNNLGPCRGIWSSPGPQGKEVLPLTLLLPQLHSQMSPAAVEWETIDPIDHH